MPPPSRAPAVGEPTPAQRPGGSTRRVIRFGRVEADWGSAVAVDSRNTLYLTGAFSRQLDFGGNSLAARGKSDAFVAAFAATGEPAWSARLGGRGTDQGTGVASLADGLVAVGDFRGAFFAAGDDTTGKSAPVGGQADGYVVRFDSGGRVVWQTLLGGRRDEHIAAVAVDRDGNVIIAGHTEGDLPIVKTEILAGLSRDVFVAKLDPKGSPIWARRFGWRGKDAARSVAVDESGDIVVAGYFADQIDFGLGPLASQSGADIFVARLDPDGFPLWGRSYGGNGADVAESVAIDHRGRIAVTGYATSDVDFGGGVLRARGGPADAVVFSLDPDGEHLWSRRYGGRQSEKGSAVAYDVDGSLLVTGVYRGDLDLGGGPLGLAAAVKGSSFVARLGGDGAHLWSRAFAGPAWPGDGGLAVAPSGLVYATGRYFNRRVDLGTGPLPHHGEVDGFVVELSP